MKLSFCFDASLDIPGKDFADSGESSVGRRRKRGFMSKLALLLATLFLMANGCVISPRRTVNGSGSGSGSNSEFSLSANPTSQTITAGAAATFTISVQAVNGFTGTVTLSASAGNSNVTASFDTTSITGGSGSAVLTVSAISTAPSGNVAVTITATDSAGNVSRNVSVTASVQAAASIAGALVATTGCVNSPAGSGIQRVSLPSTPPGHGFTATFDATPSAAIDASLGFFAPIPGPHPALSEFIRFSPAGFIQARDGDALAPSNVRYTAGETYHFRLTENLPAVTYSVFVTPPGATEIPLGINLQVPLDQRGATALTGWGLTVNGPDAATLSICNFDIR